jgi:hypothetical protein
MNDLEPIDLSPLDPERDPKHWALLVDVVRLRVEAAVAERAREPDALAVLSGWARPILAAAAALLVLGTAAITLREPAVPATTEARRLAYLAESSVLHGRPPTGAQVMNAIGRRATR